MKRTKKQAFQGNLERLAAYYGVTIPTLTIGACGGNRGLYFKAEDKMYKVAGFSEGKIPVYKRFVRERAGITIAPKAPLETLAHEFAHHMVEEMGVQLNDCHDRFFWEVLAGIRAFIAGPSMARTQLEGRALDRVPAEWKF